VVVYRAPDGTFRFPPAPTSLSTAKYDRDGYERIELRGWADVRRFESQMNAQERHKIERRIERQSRALEQGESLRRSDFHAGLHSGLRVPETELRHGEVVHTGRTLTVHLSPRVRDIARIIMDRNNQKRPRSYDPGFHVTAYSMDRGRFKDD